MVELHAGHQRTTGDAFRFVLWAPQAAMVELELPGPPTRSIPLATDGSGYWQAEVQGLADGDCYWYRLDGRRRRGDPAAHRLPLGVHGPAAVVDHAAFTWNDAGHQPPPLAQLVLYELHLGTFTDGGTFASAIGQLDHLVELGINAVELMPICPFPGERNWGYDGVAPYGVQESYGGPVGLKAFVAACHARGLAVILDVVHNHLGPEGNYLRDFGPYFTDRYQTPWGEAVNFDGPGSDAVRNYFIGSALHWLEHYHLDGLRLDAIHTIFDQRPNHYLAEFADRVRTWAQRHDRRIYLIAESHLNDPRLTTPTARGGLGMDSVWNDDFHHAVHTLLTGEADGYYRDYGRLEQLAQSLTAGFCYQGQFSAYRQRRHGAPSGQLPATAFVNWLQTHDQIGNRREGERLASLLPPPALRVAAALLLLAPGIPLLFMGEEWGETNPFLYFIHHGDPQLVEAVRQGRGHEFHSFAWAALPPDPQAETSLQRSRLDWRRPNQEPHASLLALHRELLRLRRQHPAITAQEQPHASVWPLDGSRTLAMERRAGAERVLALFNLDAQPATLHCSSYLPAKCWQRLLSTEESRFGGSGREAPASLPEKLQLPGFAAAIYRGHAAAP